MTGPNKDIAFPLEKYHRLCFLKNIIKNLNIVVGVYTYIHKFETVDTFNDIFFRKLIKFSFESIVVKNVFIMERSDMISETLQ